MEDFEMNEISVSQDTNGNVVLLQGSDCIKLTVDQCAAVGHKISSYGNIIPKSKK